MAKRESNVKTSYIDEYYDVRVGLAPDGELLLILPIFADQTDGMFEGDEVDDMLGTDYKLSFRVSEQIGYILYHPKYGEMVYNIETSSVLKYGDSSYKTLIP